LSAHYGMRHDFFELGASEQNRGPMLFFAVIESKGEERSYAYRLAAVMGFNNVGINDGGSDAGQQMIMHCPTFII
jgi:hypothetical protein